MIWELRSIKEEAFEKGRLYIRKDYLLAIMQKPKLSVIVPVYNEEKTIKKFLSNLVNTLNKAGLKYEIVVIDDNSADMSGKEILSFSKKRKEDIVYLHNEENMGRGYSLARAFNIGKYNYLIYFDADVLINLETLNNFVKYLEKYDLVIASKHLKGSIVSNSLIRTCLSYCYSVLAKALINKEITDFQCGLKAIKKSSYVKIENFLEEKKWSFDTELIMYSGMNNFKIKEIPIKLDFLKRDSKVSVLRDSFFMGIGLIKLYIKKVTSINTINYFNKKADVYGSKRYKQIQAFFKNEATELLNYAKPKKGEDIIDIGCGDGFYSIKLKQAGARVEGVDISEEMIHNLSSQGIIGHIEKMENFAIDKKFDKAIISGSLEFSLTAFGAFKNIGKHLKKGGKIIILFPRKNIIGLAYFTYHLINGITIRLFSKKELNTLLGEAGFINIKTKDINWLTTIAYADAK